jgi:hypothetical protein
MKGLKPILTVSDLMQYLICCSPDAKVTLMPENGDGFLIGGVLEFNVETPAQVWILIDEFSKIDGGQVMEWSGGSPDDDETGIERPGDMATILEAPEVTGGVNVLRAKENKGEQSSTTLQSRDVVQIRGKLRSA